jgi:hypothetical protein
MEGTSAVNRTRRFIASTWRVAEWRRGALVTLIVSFA